MRATGIVRRIDDLGRIVIPKEIRRTVGIQEGDPLEIYVDGDNIIFKLNTPESPQEQLKKVLESCQDKMSMTAGELIKATIQILNMEQKD